MSSFKVLKVRSVSVLPLGLFQGVGIADDFLGASVEDNDEKAAIFYA